MPVPLYPNPTPGRRHRLLGLSLSLLLAAAPLLAKGPEQPLRISLDTVGFQPVSAQFLLAGGSMFTLHYVDDSHLLLTFTVRRLLTRLSDEPEDDQDRNVDALLLELPTGRILARTSWRFHDHGQYLWSLGHGHFLLRVRDKLTTFAPLVNLSTGEPFREHPFLNTENRRIAAVLLSPDPSLLIVETVRHVPPAPPQKAPLFGPTPPPPPSEELSGPSPVQINFYRLSAPADTSESVTPRAAGVVRANNIGSIPSTTAGYLAVVDQGRQHWAFDFNSFAGKTNELAPFDSTCRPMPLFVSRSEFIALGCHNGNTRQVVGGFNMRGEEMWEQNVFGDYLAPSMDFAPSSGRFVFSRVLLRSSTAENQLLTTEEMSGQSIIVYQTSSGKQILHAECSPVERSGQNFTLSPNGLGLAVIHADAIEIYSLPPLTAKEQSDVKLAEASAPQDNEAPVHFAADQTPPPSSDAESAGQPDPDAFVPTPVSSDSQSPVQPAGTNAAGDPSPGAPRKPPTLYTLPTDPPHNQTTEEPK
jgi:hypothetical protein